MSTASVPTTTRASGSTPAVFGSGFPETSTTSVPARASSSSLTRVTPVRRTRSPRRSTLHTDLRPRARNTCIRASSPRGERPSAPLASGQCPARGASQPPRTARSVQHAQDASLALLSHARAPSPHRDLSRFGGPSHESHDTLGEETGSRVVVSAVDGFHERPRPAL